MPGGIPGAAVDPRSTYAVGSIQVQYTGPGALFSGADAVASGLPPYNNGPVRQVAMLQANFHDLMPPSGTVLPGSAAQRWQCYFYGVSRPGSTTRDTNARAVSAWEAPSPFDARVAICGETYDDALALSQSPNGWLGSSANGSSGYLAVYNGRGDLLWTYHFFTDKGGNPNPNESCVITDLSIRVDAEGNEIVTYCGIYNGGDPLAGSALSPLKPFDSPATGLASGATTHAVGDWDGFVGRLKRTPAGVTSREFHSIVGGLGQDGLFGIAEIDENKFVAVGATSLGASQTKDFPIYALDSVGPFAVGTVMVFDASNTNNPGGNGTSNNLWLRDGHFLGGMSETTATFARDVAVGRRIYYDIYSNDVLCDAIYVVGSTNDAAFSANWPANWVQPPSYGPTAGQPDFNTSELPDGFLAVVAMVDSNGATVPLTYSYWGSEGNDGLVGVSCWSEFPDLVAVVGFSDQSGSLDIGVSTFFSNTAFGANSGAGGSMQYPNNTDQLHEVRGAFYGGDGVDQPAMAGTTNATNGFATSPLNLLNPGELGPATAGGVALGNDGRINIVGRAFAWQTSAYPATVGVGRGPDPSQTVNGTDAVRTELDMLPWDSGNAFEVGRTDGTGDPIPTPGYPINTTGTTPTCALSPYGIRIGEAAPELARMLIDYQGTPPAGGVADAAVMVSRPTAEPGSLALTILQVGFPPPTPWATITGCELWLGDPATSNFIFPDAGLTDRPLRMPLGLLPVTTGVQFATQAVCLLLNPVGAGGTCGSTWTASPALWFSY